MLSVLWLIPLAVIAVSLWPLVWATRTLAAELVAFRDAVHALRELRPALAVVGDDLRRARRTLENRPLR